MKLTKCEAVEKTIQCASGVRCQTVFVSKCFITRGRSLSGSVGPGTITWKSETTLPYILRCTSTTVQNTVTNLTKSDLFTKRLVFLPIDWDKNGLLFTKSFVWWIRLLVFHRQELIWAVFSFVVHIKHIYMVLRRRFGVGHSIPTG